MADRIYKGRLKLTGEICHENLAFTEASEDFDKPHKGGLVPFEVLTGVIESVMDAAYRDDWGGFEMVDGSAFIKGDGKFEGIWIKIDPDGTIEIGAGAA